MSKGGNIVRIVSNAAVFILLEVAALVMLRHNGQMQNIWISKGIHAVQGAIWGGTESVRNYFSLRRQNDSLATENSRLRNIIREYRSLTGKTISADSVGNVIGGFRYTHATTVKVSNNKQHNYLILDKGSEDGIEEFSGIITDKGVIGIIDAVGKNYSYARSFKNTGMVVSARIGKEGPVGEMIWDGVSSNGAQLINGYFQSTGNHLQKTSGAGRAFVIHQEIAQVTVIIKLNHFAVLTTDVDYRARCWLKKPCAQPVTGDFRHLFIGKIHQLPSIAGERQKRRCL